MSFGLMVLLGNASRRMADPESRVATEVLAGLVVVLPTPWTLSALCVGQLIHYGLGDAGRTMVHPWLISVICALALLTLGASFDRDPRVWEERFVDAFWPVGLGLAGLCFFAAGLSKLNTSFFDPRLSCGAVFYDQIHDAVPLFPGGTFFETLAIHGTGVMELGGPVLLIHPRTRRAGFFLCWLMLFLIGTNPVSDLWEFAGPFVLLMAFAFDWSGAARRVLGELPSPSPRVRIVFAAAFGLVLVAALQSDGTGPAYVARTIAARWLFALGALLAVAVVAWSPLATSAGLPRRTRVGWCLVALMGAHEALPYLGMEGDRNFTVASGLVHTPRWSNHLLLPPPPTWTMNRPVLVLASDERGMQAHEGRVWPWVAFSDHVARHPDIDVLFELDGVRYHKKATDPADGFARSWLVHFLRLEHAHPEPRERTCHHRRDETRWAYRERKRRRKEREKAKERR
jgi:hypothetical protein